MVQGVPEKTFFQNLPRIAQIAQICPELPQKNKIAQNCPELSKMPRIAQISV